MSRTSIGLSLAIVGLGSVACVKGDYVDGVEVGIVTGTNTPMATGIAYPLRFYRSREVPTPKNTGVEKETVVLDSVDCSAPCRVTLTPDGSRTVASDSAGTFELHATGRGASTGEAYDPREALRFVGGVRVQLEAQEGLRLTGRRLAPGKLPHPMVRWVDGSGESVRAPHDDSTTLRSAAGSCTLANNVLTFGPAGKCVIEAGLAAPAELTVADVKDAVGLTVVQALKGSDYRCTANNVLLVGYVLADGSEVVGGAEHWAASTPGDATNGYVFSYFFPDAGGELRAERGSFRQSVQVRDCTK